MFTAERLQELLNVIRPPFKALFLYGSHARGDADEHSDIDILQVTPSHTEAYNIGSINVTCYTLNQLVRLARRGGLFARHLVQEANALIDPDGILENLRSQYVGPSGYLELKKEIRGCAPLLDVSRSEFAENPEGLCTLVGYLLRSYLYALAFEHGGRSFSMSYILHLLGLPQIRQMLANVKSQPTYSHFVTARSFYVELTGTDFERTEGSVEAFVVNASAHNELAMILGLRLLAKGRPFTYDALLGVEL